jgi:hypothetical protein
MNELVDARYLKKRTVQAFRSCGKVPLILKLAVSRGAPTRWPHL